MTVMGTLSWVTHPLHQGPGYPPYLGMEFNDFDHMVFHWVRDDGTPVSELVFLPKDDGDLYYWSQPPEEWK